MPYIKTTTNAEISKEKETVLKTKLGQAIALIPGKSETWLMTAFDDEISMYFQGNGDKTIVYVEVAIFGSASDNAYDALTAEITNIMSQELSASPSDIYVKYEEVSHWGWNGRNF